MAIERHIVFDEHGQMKPPLDSRADLDVFPAGDKVVLQGDPAPVINFSRNTEADAEHVAPPGTHHFIEQLLDHRQHAIRGRSGGNRAADLFVRTLRQIDRGDHHLPGIEIETDETPAGWIQFEQHGWSAEPSPGFRRFDQIAALDQSIDVESGRRGDQRQLAGQIDPRDAPRVRTARIIDDSRWATAKVFLAVFFMARG